MYIFIHFNAIILLNYQTDVIVKKLSSNIIRFTSCLSDETCNNAAVIGILKLTRIV